MAPAKIVIDVIAQGSKEVFLGHERYQYAPYHYLLFTAELPVVSQIIEASPERPYLSIRLDLDPTLVGSIMAEAGYSSPPNYADVKAINVSALDASMLEAMVRLARLLDTPVMPLIAREIVYRLLRGEQSGRLRHIAVLGDYTHRIARAIERLRNEFDQPLRIEDMAPGTGHERFGLPPPLQGGHGDESFAVPKAAAAARGPPVDARRAARRGQCGLSGGV